MSKKDLGLIILIGALVGLLVQPLLSTLETTIVQAGLAVTPMVRIGLFFFFLILAPLALFIAHLLGKLWSVLYQFAKFAAVGTLNSMIDIGIVNLLIAFTGIAAGSAYVLFKAISFFGATTNSFFWNKLWTFDSHNKTSAEAAFSFYVIAGIGWALNVAAAGSFVNFLPRPDTIGENLWANLGVLIGIGVSFLWNFLGYKYFVFRPKPDVARL